MITVTKRAAEHIKASTDKESEEELFLRLAAKENDDGSIEYGLGMDEVREGDEKVNSSGVTVVIAQESQDLLKGCALDFVDIEDGQPQFIFMNPNDPNYVPPTEVDITEIPSKHGEN